MGKKIYFFLYIVLLYFVLYNPPLFFLKGGIKVSYAILAVSILIFLNKPRIVLSDIKTFRIEYKLFVYLLLFVVLRSFFLGEYGIISRHIVCFLQTFLLLPILYIYSPEKKEKRKVFIRALLITSVIGATFSILCLAFPEFNAFVKTKLIQYTIEDYLYNNDYRGYGIADALTSNYGFLQGFIVIIGLYYYKENKWFAFFAPFVFLSAILNARTGGLLALFGLVILAGMRSNKTVAVASVLIVTFLVFGGMNSLLDALNASDQTKEWILDSFTQVESVYENEGDLTASSTLQHLYQRSTLPDDLGTWILGRGFDLFGNNHGVMTVDMGWVRQINYGGFLYCIPLYFFVIIMIKRLIRLNLMPLSIIILITIILLNTKTYYLYSSGSCFMILMMMYFLNISEIKLKQ